MNKTGSLAGLACITTLGLTAATLLATDAQASPGYLTAFAAAYPGSSSDNNASCELCHGSTTGNLNEYGYQFFRYGSFSIVEAFPSVNAGGGTSNLDEINASTQPGWTVGRVNTLYNTYSGDVANSSAPAPATILGDLDPPVANDPPTADPGGPYAGILNSPVSFDGSASTDSDGSIVSYDWDFGDGDVGTGVDPDHRYLAPGTYTVSLTVTDDDGDDHSATTTVAIPTWADRDEGGSWKRRIQFPD